MARKKLAPIEVGYHTFPRGGEEAFGAVREVLSTDRALVVYVEDYGDVRIPLDAVGEVVEEKVIIDTDRLDAKVREAIAKAHRDEDFP